MLSYSLEHVYVPQGKYSTNTKLKHTHQHKNWIPHLFCFIVSQIHQSSSMWASKLVFKI